MRKDCDTIPVCDGVATYCGGKEHCGRYVDRFTTLCNATLLLANEFNQTGHRQHLICVQFVLYLLVIINRCFFFSFN